DSGVVQRASISVRRGGEGGGRGRFDLAERQTAGCVNQEGRGDGEACATAHRTEPLQLVGLGVNEVSSQRRRNRTVDEAAVVDAAEVDIAFDAADELA